MTWSVLRRAAEAPEDEARKGIEIPNIKSPIPNKFQLPNPNDRNKTGEGRFNRLKFGYSLLGIYLEFGVWDLGFGIWDLEIGA
jgi:hypothetical protein